ncbi:hypothetical protein VFPPC_18700 [Pochonia chlamydosporia 170]|uniref:Uncharacterized protein n=1 Tax=Pochonia chlamydosporia 170 TaxID=1380566 RepID=A0A219AS07_METCM|nr:hypothetical protein VFPPC_18700 [Pochonia chlamydosporia 170]OWT43573.1 hypothetical protein VFPPC_18700 [Pochonia chlamydosporia 170]
MHQVRRNHLAARNVIEELNSHRLHIIHQPLLRNISTSRKSAYTPAEQMDSKQSSKLPRTIRSVDSRPATNGDGRMLNTPKDAFEANSHQHIRSLCNHQQEAIPTERQRGRAKASVTTRTPAQHT